MPRHCSVGGCKSRDNRETRNAGITFHKLPKGELRRNLWISKSHRADPWDPQTDFVYFCSKHFTPESFELTGCSGIRRLKEDAFPTVFDFSSTTKCKRQEMLRRKEDSPVRKHSCSGEQENVPEAGTGEPAHKLTMATAEETCENELVSSQEPPGLDQHSPLQTSPSPPPMSRPNSPSCYMRRLPPPPGFYLSKEHSYAQLCPLLWRRRYDQAIDCLEKALRQLHAARRRENRLRSTMLRLRDKRLKQALLVSQDGCKTRGSWTSEEERRRGKGGWNQECESESEGTGVFEDRCVDHMEVDAHFLSDTNNWSEDGKGYCFYCGRGQVQLSKSVSEMGKDTQPALHLDSLKSQRSFEINTAEKCKDIHIVRLERSPGKREDSGVTNSEVLYHTQGPQPAVTAGVSPANVQEQSLQWLGFRQKSLLSDTPERGTEATGQEQQLDLQQQLFWIQNSTEGQVVLVPVPVEDRFQSVLKMEGVSDEIQTILVSEVDLKGDTRESSGDLSRAETVCDDEHSDQPSDIDTTCGEMREDVREKLKEHLEGFHLQLSTEFLS